MNGYSRSHRFPASLAVIVLLGSGLTAPAQPPDASERQGNLSAAAFKRSMELQLDDGRARIRKIAEPLLERVKKMNGTSDDLNIPVQSIKIQQADAVYQNAKITREVAEIAVKEYAEGIYLQDRATAQGELELAESDLKRSDAEIARTSDLLERVKRAATGTVLDFIHIEQVEAMAKMAILSKEKAKFTAEQVRSKLKLLDEYEKPKRLAELRSAVERARSDELSEQQTLELEKAKLVVMKKRAEGYKVPEKYKLILSLLADAVQLEGQVRDKLAKLDLQKELPQGEPIKQITDMAGTLMKKLNEADRLLEDLKFSDLAREI